MEIGKIGIIHLSDIHIVEDKNANIIFSRIDKIVESLSNKLLGIDHLFLIISGDVAFSGTTGQYVLAKEFIAELKQKLESSYKKNIFVVGVPGNHDCDFSSHQKTRDLILDGLESQGFRDLDSDIIAQCCLPQENYFDFQNSTYFTDSTIILSNKLLTIAEYKIKDASIVFNCFNTAWTSRIKEHEGKMAFPVDFFSSEDFNNSGTVRINLIHHPLNWQNSSSHRELKKFINMHGDITLSGHEHSQDANSLINSIGHTNIYIEAAALQDSNIAAKCSFNFITLDIQNSLLNAKTFHFKEGKFIVKDLLKDREFAENVIGRTIAFNLNNAWSEYLDSPGAQLLHRRAEKLFLDDLFVSPYLRVISEENEKASIINFSKLQEGKEIGKVILVGESSSGKTTLCKRIFKDCHTKGLIPILINGNEIDQPDITYIFNDLLRKAFSKQYNRAAQEKFDNIDKSKIVVIVDDLQTCELEDIHRKKFVNELNTAFENIVFTSSSHLYFNPLTDGDTNFSEYNSHTLLEASYEVRYSLIQKWNSIGETECFGNDLIRRNENYDTQIKSFLGKSYLPHFPFTILVALQSIDNSDSSEQGFSYYYKYLIEASLKKHIKNIDDLQFYHFFLSEFCYFLFQEKISSIDKDSFEDYFKRYVVRKKVTIYYRDALNQLLLSRTLKLEGDFISVAYKYIYYYYVSNFIAINISIDKDGEIKKLVRNLIDRLYVDEYSSIIIFLTQISSDPFVISTLREHVGMYFSEYKPAMLGEDIKEMDELLLQLPELILVDRNIDENRKTEIQRREHAENQENALDNEYKSNDFDINEDISSLSLLKSFIRAIKTFEIFAQVIKRNWGAYEGDQKAIYVNETLLLLRGG